MFTAGRWQGCCRIGIRMREVYIPVQIGEGFLVRSVGLCQFLTVLF